MSAPRWVGRANASASLSIVLGIAVLAALTGCGSTPADPSASPSADASQTPAAAPGPSQSGAPVGPTIPPGATSVPAPGAGATPAADGPTEAAALPTESARLGDEIAFETGIVVEIVSVEPITVTAETPGEISGAALRVSVAARNESGRQQEVGSAVVSVIADDGELGIGTTAGSPSPLSGVIDPGGTASGTYVFMLDPASGRDVTVSVNYAAGQPLAVFTGSI